MKRVTYPHLGTLYITSEHFFRALGLVPVTPPFPSRRTLDLGVRHRPEMTCAPCKILFGNYYEGLELGADQLILFGGPDTCRLGYLARPQAERLHDAGFRFTPHTLSLRGIAADILRVARELADPSPLELLEAARTLLASLSLVDEIEQESLGLRPRKQERGAATRLRREALAAVRACRGRAELQARREAILTPLRTAPADDGRRVFRVGLVGDTYSISEPSFNMNVGLAQFGQAQVDFCQFQGNSHFASSPVKDVSILLAGLLVFVAGVVNVAQQFTGNHVVGFLFKNLGQETNGLLDLPCFAQSLGFLDTGCCL
jgi:hypothetical protein